MGKLYTTADLPADPKFDADFHQYETQDHLPHEHQALRRLRYVARIVFPLMRDHGWSNIALRESQLDLGEYGSNDLHFSPWKSLKSHSIHLLLRYSDHPDIFLPLETVVQTLVHEL